MPKHKTGGKAMQVFLFIVFTLMMGCATAYFANQRGRDPVIWFMLGMLLGLFGLLLLFLLPPVPDEEHREEEAEYALLEQKSEIAPAVQTHEYLIKDWYYYDATRTRQGPVRIEALKNLWTEGLMNEDTYVWCEGMDNWQPVEQVQNLHTYLQLT